MLINRQSSLWTDVPLPPFALGSITQLFVHIHLNKMQRTGLAYTRVHMRWH